VPTTVCLTHKAVRSLKLSEETRNFKLTEIITIGRRSANTFSMSAMIHIPVVAFRLVKPLIGRLRDASRYAVRGHFFLIQPTTHSINKSLAVLSPWTRRVLLSLIILNPANYYWTMELNDRVIGSPSCKVLN